MASYPPYQPGAYQPLYNQQPYQQPPVFQPQQAVQPPQQTINGRVVTSREEALGVPVDFMGGLMVFPDVSHGRIYTKIFNPQTGSSVFCEYLLATPQSTEPRESYASMSELESLRAEVAGLKELVDKPGAKRRPTKEASTDE